MPKWTALGNVDTAGAADVNPDSVSNIYDEESLGIPKPGPYLALVKRLQGVESKAGDPMLKMVVELAEPKNSKKARYNGYGIWNYIVSTKDTASRVNQFLHAILDGKTPAQRQKIVQAYWAGNVVVDDDGFITKIGTWMVPDSILIGINTAKDNSAEYGERLKIAFGGIMPASERPATKADAEEADDDDEVDDDDTDEEVEEEEGDADEEARAEELDGLSLAELRKLAKELGVTGKGKPGLIDAILDAEFAEDADEDEEAEEDADEDEDEDEEPEGDEYDEMDRAALRVAAKEYGIRVLKSMSDEDLRLAVRGAALEQIGEEPEEEDEEEPEPEVPAKKGRARATAAAPGRAAAKRRKGSEDEPPF